MRSAIAILIALLVFAASACGGSEDSAGSARPATGVAATSPDRAAAVDALVAMLQDDPEMPLSDEEAECTANALLESVSVEDAMFALGTDNFDDSALAGDVEFMNAVLDCVDLDQMMIESMMADGATEEEANCMADAFGADELRQLVEMSMLDDDEVNEEAAMGLMVTMMAASASCGMLG